MSNGNNISPGIISTVNTESVLAQVRRNASPSRVVSYFKPTTLTFDPRLTAEQKLTYKSQLLSASELAPAAQQPSPDGAALNPNTVPVPGDPPKPAEDARAAEDAALVAAFAQQMAAEEAAKESYTPRFNTVFTDPESFINTKGDLLNRLTNIYSFVLFDHWDPDPVKRVRRDSVELPFVQRISMQAPNAVSRMRGLNGLVYAEHAGFVQRMFTIEGRSGPVWGADDSEQLLISRFTALRNFIEQYGQLSANNKNAWVRYKDTRLIMYASFESEAHFCDIVGFNYRRSTDTSTYSFEYSLTIVTNGIMGRTFKPGKLVSPPNAKTEVSLYADYRTAWDAENSAVWARITDTEDLLKEEQIQFDRAPTLENMSCSTLQSLRLDISTASSLLDASIFTEGVSVLARTTAKAALNWNSYALDIAHRIKGGNNLSCPVPPWSDLYYNLIPTGTLGAAALRYIMDNVQGKAPAQPSYAPDIAIPFRPGLMAPSNNTPEPPFTATTYFLSEGTTDAYSVAALVLGDRNYYWRIIDLNGMRDAYTRGDGTPLVPGTSLLVPAPEVNAAKDNDVLGTDLLVVNGDLFLVGNNDVMRVSGFACYSQNLMHRMQTPRGTNRTFPNYGLPDTLNTSASSTVPATIREEVRDQLLQDHRTDSVKNLTLEEQGDKVVVNVLVTPLTGTARRFEFNYNLNAEVTP